MDKLEKMQAAIDILKDQDIDALKSALALVGDPVQETLSNVSDKDFEVGKNYFVRTVTFYVVGKVTKITNNMVHFEQASWIADTGRFADAIKTGDFNEIEPVGIWFVSLGAIVDGGPFNHTLPTKQK